MQPAQKQSVQNPPKFLNHLNQTRHRGAQSVTSAEPGQEPKLLDQVSQVLRTMHYSIRTEKTYIDWIYRFIMFHNKRHPREMGEAEISQFLTYLAVEKHVAPSTQNQALAAILFLYKHVLRMDLGRVEFPWAKKPDHLPVILSLEEVRKIISLLPATYALMARLLYGCGLRISECAKLRIKDIDFGRSQIFVRLIVEERPWQPAAGRIPMNKKMRIRVQYGEVNLGRQVRAIGGKWNRQKQVWELPYQDVLRLGLTDRITE